MLSGRCDRSVLILGGGHDDTRILCLRKKYHACDYALFVSACGLSYAGRCDADGCQMNQTRDDEVANG